MSSPALKSPTVQFEFILLGVPGREKTCSVQSSPCLLVFMGAGVDLKAGVQRIDKMLAALLAG